MRKLYKIFLIIMTIGMILQSLLLAKADASKKLGKLEYSKDTHVTDPCLITQTSGSCFGTNEKGETIYYTIYKGNPAGIVAYNIDTAKIEDIQLLQGAGGSNKATSSYSADMGPDGIIYIAANSQFYTYNPKGKKLVSYGTIFTEKAVMNKGDFDEDGNYYFGTFPNACLIQFNVKKNQLINLGTNMVTGQYVRAVAVYGNKVFMGSAGTPKNAQIVKYDIKTKRRSEIPLPDYEGFLGKDCGTIYTISILGGKYMAAKASMGKYAQLVLDMETEEWIDMFKGPNHTHISELDGDVTYFAVDNIIKSRNIITKEEKIFDNLVLYASKTLVSPKIATLKNQEKYPGKSLIANSGENGLLIVNFKKETVEYISEGFPMQPVGMRTIHAGYNNDIICSAMQGAYIYIYNTFDNNVRTAPSVQIEGMEILNGKYYLGLYGSGGGITEFDPTKPAERGVNPKLISTMQSAKKKQDRVFVIKKAEDKIIYGSIPYYGYLGGCIAVYDPKTGKTKVYEDIIPNHSITGLEYKDGKIYGTTCVYGGLGVTAIEDTAKMFIMDLETGKLELAKDVVLKKDKSKQYFAGELSFSKEGRLFMGTNNVLVELDPKDLSILREEVLGSRENMTIEDTRWQGFFLEWAPNGLLFTNVGGKVIAVDIDDFKSEVVYNNGTSSFTLGTDGNLYFLANGGASINKIELSGIEEDRIETIKKSSLIIKVDSSKALYFGVPKSIDTQNNEVRAKVVDKRTLVPVRFLAENYGAKVEWNEETKTVTLTMGEKEASITLGENKIKVEDEEIIIDVPAMSIENRTMLPLRAFIEDIMGKTIYYHDKTGLVVISNTDLIEENNDTVILEELSEHLN